MTTSSRTQIEQVTGPTTMDLKIHLLGQPYVTWTGHPLSIPRRQARALLYRLATGLAPLPREHLCFLFWPDIPESNARRNLSHLLTHLRRALPAPELLLTQDDRVGLNPRRTWSDVVAFEQLCATLESARRTEALQQAVDLYRGAFLSGFSLPASPEFETWTLQERHSWEQLYLKALFALVEECTSGADYDAAIVYALRYLEADDLAEEMHRRLIALYAATGKRGAALHQFERCAAALERELGVRPLPETRAVYRAVLEDRPPPDIVAGVEPARAALPGPRVPLVGREGALSRLERAYNRARAGRGGVMLISGEAGIGKSRLMQDFVERHQGEALVLAGAGYPCAQSLPYQSLTQALRAVLSVELGRQPRGTPSPPALLQSIAQIWLSEAAQLLPELRTWYPDLPPPMMGEPNQARARLFEALCQLTLGLAGGPRPLLLCLDDLHWTDGATLDWLVYLGRRLAEGQCLVIGTYRSEENKVVAGLRQGLFRLKILSELKLSGLDATAIRQLLQHLVGARSGHEALARRLQGATGGNPFFLLETLRALSEAGWPGEDLADLQDLPLPNTIREAVQARLERLSPKARQILEAGAVLGLTFGFDLALRTAGRDEMETADGLDELVARQLLTEQAADYRFHHDLTRRVVEEGLGPMRRQLLHRRAGRALEQLQPDALAGLAYHFDVGGETEKALHYHDLAAQRAEALFTWREAEAHHSRVLELSDRLDPDGRAPAYLVKRGEALTARAHLQFLLGRLRERDVDLIALDKLAQASGDQQLRLQALIHRSRYLNLDGQYIPAIAAAEEGLALARSLEDAPACSRLLAHIGFADYFLGRPGPALAALESALEMAGEEAGPEMRGRIVHILGYVHFHLGGYARSLAYQQEAYTCHEAIGDYNRVAWDGLDIAALHLELGRFAEARQYVTQSLALARQIGAQPVEAYGLTHLGMWELYTGHYALAADYFQQSLPLQRQVRSEHGSAAAEVGTGYAYYFLGDLAEARYWLVRAVGRTRSIGHRRRMTEALIGLGLVEMADGKPSAARWCLIEAMTLAQASECRENLAASLTILARVERHTPGGDLASALAYARKALSVAQEIDSTTCAMWGEAEIGLTLLAQGEPAAALKHTGRAVALVPQAHESWGGTEQIHRAHAQVLRALNRPDEADEQRQLADAIVASKAHHIPDDERRQQYIQYASTTRL